ncbi:MAG: ComF family protein [Cyanobacteria bacterium P01_F01_bin.150]
MVLQRLVQPVLNVFSSPKCGLCDRPTHTILCHDCQTQFLSCQSTNPQQFWQPPLPVFAWGQYTGVLKRGIAALKYDNQPDIAQLLGQWLGEAWLRSRLAQSSTKPSSARTSATGGLNHHRRVPRSLLVIPAPANESKKKRRGYDQAELIARAFCRYTRLPLGLRRVYRTKDTLPMYGLSRQDRYLNVQGKFCLHPRFEQQIARQIKRQGKHRHRQAPAILLLDDIHTSGATLGAIAQLLRQHQLSVYGAVTVAKAGVGQDKPS